jgi:uncharacterized phage infection (PIP) family protein YhgE
MEWLGVDRRRLGSAMVAFGLAGMVMAAIVAVALILGAFAARDLDTRLAADQARITASLTRLAATMESLASTTQNAGTTLQTTSEALTDARDVLESTSTALASLSDALNIDILGRRPFAAASENLAELALTIGTFEGKAETLALNLDQNATDATAMTDKIRQLTVQVDELASRVDGFDRISEMVNLLLGGIVLAALLTAWVGIAAGFCAWVGWKLRRIAAAGAPGEPEDTGPGGRV